MTKTSLRVSRADDTHLAAGENTRAGRYASHAARDTRCSIHKVERPGRRAEPEGGGEMGGWAGELGVGDRKAWRGRRDR